MARAALAPAALPLQSWLSLATELRSIEETLDRLADSTTLLPDVSRSASCAAEARYRRLIVRIRKERRTAELLAHPGEIPEPPRRLA